MIPKPVRPWLPGQATLLPTDIGAWLPSTHLVWFILEVIERLDMSRFTEALNRKDPRGNAPYDPRMMAAMLMYAYSVGVFSSRRIERATYEDVAFRVLTADQHPDHDTIAAFRREHLDAFKEMFVQVLRIAHRMGLVGFGVLGLDGVKILANASKHEAMSYDRMRKEVAALQAEIDRLLALADRADADEARFGDGRVMDIPAELERRQERKAKIEKALAALEQETRRARIDELEAQRARHEQRASDSELDPKSQKLAATLAQQRSERIAELEAANPSDDDQGGSDDDDTPGPDGDLPRHTPDHDTDGTPTDKAQRNFTDPDSRIMVRDGDHYVQAYNAQAVVDDKHQIIVAVAVGNQPPDCEYLVPMLDRVRATLDAAHIDKPPNAPLAADAGYFSEANVAGAEARGFDPYIAPERIKHRRYDVPGPLEDPPPSEEPRPDAPPAPKPTPESTTQPTPPTPREAMRAKLKTEKGAAIYGKRKTTPEPVFGQILHVRGFRRFSLRGLAKVRGEWFLVSLTHNLLKAWRSGATLPAPA